MEAFKYKALDRRGGMVRGTLKAPDKSSALQHLREMELTPVDIENAGFLNADIKLKLPVKVKIKDITIFARQFSILLQSGIAVLSALDILVQQTENITLKKVIANMLEEVKKGRSLTMAMRMHKQVFPDMMLNMVEAGELSGNLDGSFAKIAAHYESELALISKIKGSLAYSVILMVVAVLVVIFLIVSVVPTFTKMFADIGVELPASTKLLLAFSGFVSRFWYIILIGLGGLAFGFVKFKNSDKGRYLLDSLILKLPAFGPLVRKIVIARFTRTLATLLASGYPLLASLEVTSRIIGNRKYQQALEKARLDVSNGVSLTRALSNTNMFMKMVVQMIKVGEDSGSMESVLDKIADFYELEVSEASSKMSTLMEPMIILFLAVVVGFIVISIIEPMFKMLTAVK